MCVQPSTCSEDFQNEDDGVHHLCFHSDPSWIPLHRKYTLGTACVFDPTTNSTSKVIYPTKFYLQNHEVIDTVTGIGPGLLLPVCYVTFVSVTTTMTLIKLRVMATWSKQMSSANDVSSKEVALTRMLIGISVLYVVCSMRL